MDWVLWLWALHWLSHLIPEGCWLKAPHMLHISSPSHRAGHRGTALKNK